MAPPGQSSNNPLPAKELGHFKKIIKYYEQKQYKFGLKFAKMILGNQQFAEHGETLAMKGLILNCMGKQEEAMDCVKKGLKSDIKSYVCWHVYGLVNRSEKKYDEAIKAYKQALNLDKGNMQILRDLALLQIQLRDYEGYKESRFQLLQIRASQRISWIGYAVAYHLLRDYEKALYVLDEFKKNDTTEKKPHDFDFSELLLYENMILREWGKPDKALEHLEENCAHILDKLQYFTIRGNLFMELGQLNNAETMWRGLISRNPEATEYYDKLENCLGIRKDDIPTRLKLYDDLAKTHPRAAAPRRQPLYFAEGDELRARLAAWITIGLRKGIPSLFKYILPLYTQPSKVSIIESILLDFIKKIEDYGYRNGSLEGDVESMESPTTALWLYLLIAQHYDKIGQFQVALKFVDRAEAHTPTLIETLMIKAKIYKHCGELNEAARLMDEAQSLDTADRYINSKCAKYLLRAGKIEEAEKMCAKFTREGERASVTLNEMQCMWYELEVARAHRALSHYGEALKKAQQIEQHFVTMVEDQFDFHTYCLRKSTLCAYVQMLRLEDTIRKHNYFYHTAKLAIKVYLRIIDRPQDMNQQNGLQDGLSANELKKLKKKMKKEKEAKEQEQKNKKDLKEEPSNPAMHFDPEVLMRTTTPLDDATKFAEPLHSLGHIKPAGTALAAEVYHRKNKPLLVLKCLAAGVAVDPNHPLLHIQKVKFLAKLSSFTSLAGAVKEVADELIATVFGSERDPHKLNEKYKQDNIDSLKCRMAVAECNVLLDPSSTSATKNWLLKSVEDEKINNRNLNTLVKLRDAAVYGKYGPWTNDEMENLNKLGHRLFPLALTFGGGLPQQTPAANDKESNNEHHTFE
ncbi:hypothetical protein WR25_10599 [Diploscapter pachys]|uniref:N-alpha-acetyltransferase 15, NatA auxiliary subunit n=1 Tax=Diploscapter pachys TaxID=2018661 RepID=A0A2A2JFR9_9BILA|nr:hypothetical protein WR25_10599 [Diploscapter pachys]